MTMERNWKQCEDLLGRMLKALGLTAKPRRLAQIMCDSAGREYIGIREDGDAQARFLLVSDVLSVKFFEHYKFPGSCRIIDNPFFGMSPEEVELKLAVMGK